MPNRLNRGSVDAIRHSDLDRLKELSHSFDHKETVKRFLDFRRSLQPQKEGGAHLLQEEPRQSGGLLATAVCSSTYSMNIHVPSRFCCSRPGFDQSHTPDGKMDCNRAHCATLNGTV